MHAKGQGRGLGGVGIDRPPFRPVMGAKLAPPHPAASQLLDADTLLGRHVAMVLVVRVQKPLPDRNRRNLQTSRQSTLTATNLNGTAQSRKVGGFHGQR